MTTYGVAKGSVAHTTVMPPDFDETAMELVTPQQTLLYKVRMRRAVFNSSADTCVLTCCRVDAICIRDNTSIGPGFFQSQHPLVLSTNFLGKQEKFS